MYRITYSCSARLLRGHQGIDGPGANVNARDRHQATTLHMAAQRVHAEAINALLKRADTKVNAEDEDRYALHTSAQHGHAEVISVLLTRSSIIVTKRDNNGYTPVQIAARYGFREAVSVLIAHIKSELSTVCRLPSPWLR